MTDVTRIVERVLQVTLLRRRQTKIALHASKELVISSALINVRQILCAARRLSFSCEAARSLTMIVRPDFPRLASQ